MNFAIISNLNGIGLQVEAELLRDYLVSLSHEVELIQFDLPWEGRKDFDVAIFFEVVNQVLIGLAPRRWYLANCEWLRPENVRPIQRHFEIVFAKTREAASTLRGVFPRVEYVGFLTKDKRDTKVKRQKRFLHIGGNSGYRNTPAVIEAWRSYRYWNGLDAPDAPLTVVSNSTTVTFEQTPGVTFIKRATDEQIIELQNSHLYHVLPSAYEGFGHALHEALSVGAVILTTGAGPMAEIKAPFEVPSIRQTKKNMGTLHDVSAKDIREMVPKMLAQPSHVIAKMQCEARSKFEKGNAEFKKLFGEFLKPRIEVMTKPTIAILGNFSAEHSTENELAWTLRDMGHPVVTFQENEDSTEEIYTGCRDVSLLIFVSTHGWITPGKMPLDDLWKKLAVKRVKTCSFHLDRYWGLNILDQREAKIGQHPFWRTDKVFTADGGNQEGFKEKGVKHVWLPPGVAKRHCFIGTPRDEWKVDVGFVGAEGYHPEYKFRGELIEFLRGAYGERFRIFTGIRGDSLNDLYASINVVVGDSCFGGSDYYWSDRVPETMGRGGVLVHPASKGLDYAGLITFPAGDLRHLQDRIEFLLENDKARDFCREAGMNWVKSNETYHNRMETLLRTMEVR